MTMLMFRQALVLYYHATTLATEVNLFWTRKLNVGAIVFLANRYLMLAFQILIMIGFAPPVNEVCWLVFVNL